MVSRPQSDQRLLVLIPFLVATYLVPVRPAQCQRAGGPSERNLVIASQQFPVSFQHASIGSTCIFDHGRQIAIEPTKWTS